MATSTVPVEQMRPKLLTLDQVHKTLAKTEPLGDAFLSQESKIKFRLDPGWEMDLDARENTETVGARLTVNGKEFEMTKEAALQAAANIGLSAAYVKKSPSTLIEPALNYFYGSGMGSDSYNLLTVKGKAAAFTRPTLVPFSNLDLLESIAEGIHDYYGDSTEILADYKIGHSLLRTDVRLIVPEDERMMRGTDMPDVPERGTDVWSAGIHLSNSLVGKTQTAIEGYMFRWWCTNGATTRFSDIGTWSRRSDGQDEAAALEWARRSIDDILGGMEERFEQVQALNALKLEGKTGDVLKEIFSNYEVPVTQRAQIQQDIIEHEGQHTMYSVMNAITRAANDPELDPKRADRLMRIGGDLPTTMFDTLKARVWREGHLAEPTAPNPYEIVPIS